MPLCGATVCGCAVTSVPAIAGELNGYLPTIDVAGNGTTISPWNLTLNDDWVDEVVSSIAGPLVSGESQAWNVSHIDQQVSGTQRAVTTRWGRRRILGDTAWVAQITLDIQQAGSAGARVLVPLPYTILDMEAVGGSFTLVDDSGSLIYAGSVFPYSTTKFALQASEYSSQFGDEPEIGIGVGDILRITLHSV